MPGRADLDDEVLVDSLVPMIDDLRDDLHGQFGVRAFRVFAVRRTYDGDSIGDGAFRDQETEILPRPRVLNLPQFELAPSGLNERGEVKVTEVSLSYAFEELTGQGANLGANEEWLIRIDEGMGQGQPSRYFVHNRPPFPDREQNMGWALFLRPVDKDGCSG